MAQRTVPELAVWRANMQCWQDIALAEEQAFSPGTQGDLLVIAVVFAFTPAVNNLGLHLDYGNGQSVTISFGPIGDRLIFGRSSAVVADFAAFYAVPD